MTPSTKVLTTDPVVELSPGKDPYIKSRKKGPARWILAHILHGTNRLFIIIIIFTIIFAANLSSIFYITIGEAISVLLSGMTGLLGDYVITILIIGISGPLLRIMRLVELRSTKWEQEFQRLLSWLAVGVML